MVDPYLANALHGYKTALDVALTAASWLSRPGGGGGGYDGGRMDRSSRGDGLEVSQLYTIPTSPIQVIIVSHCSNFSLTQTA